MFRNRLPDKLLKEKLERQARPENCDTAKPTRVNPGIWRKLREPTQKRHLQLFKIQQALVKGIIPIARLTDLSMTEKKGLDKEGVQHIKQFGLDALSLLTHVNYELNMQRKQLMNIDIGRDYASLCSPHVPFTDWLFGDDLQKQLKDIGDVNKIGAKVQGHRGPHRPQTGYVNNNNSKGSFSHRNQSKNLLRSPTQTTRGHLSSSQSSHGKCCFKFCILQYTSLTGGLSPQTKASLRFFQAMWNLVTSLDRVPRTCAETERDCTRQRTTIELVIRCVVIYFNTVSLVVTQAMSLNLPVSCATYYLF